MDYHDREKLLRRVFSGRVLVQIDDQFIGKDFVLFKHPNLGILQGGDFAYQEAVTKYIKSGAIPEKELLEEAIKRKIWSPLQETSIEAIAQYIVALQKQLDSQSTKYNSILIDDLKKKIHEAQIKLFDLRNKRLQITQYSIESMALIYRRDYIIRQITYIKVNNKYRKLFNSPLINHINIDAFITYLSELYYNDYVISLKDMRELARTSPWRVYYKAATTSGGQLFPNKIFNYTIEQTDLLYWSAIYDYAYENSERPIDAIIDNDDRFNEWLEFDINKNKKRIEENFNKVEKPYLPSSKWQGRGVNEVFIAATPDNVSKIDELNSPVAKAIKSKYLSEILKAGREIEDIEVRQKLGPIVNKVLEGN